jgi:hypothetical protein
MEQPKGLGPTKTTPRLSPLRFQFPGFSFRPCCAAGQLRDSGCEVFAQSGRSCLVLSSTDLDLDYSEKFKHERLRKQKKNAVQFVTNFPRAPDWFNITIRHVYFDAGAVGDFLPGLEK